MSEPNFNTKEWNEKRRTILHRDNYTCQRCKVFNPNSGVVELISSDPNFTELHEYDSSPGHSLYRISSQKNNLTIEINFDTDWLVLPVLQIHHTKYINGRSIWDYNDGDLITLCKQCHTSIHATETIPIYDLNGKLLEYRHYQPEDNGSGRNHNYKPWIFIRKDKNKGEYVATGVSPSVSYILFGDEDSGLVKTIVDQMVADFFIRFLPSYHK